MPLRVHPEAAFALWREHQLTPLTPFKRANDPWPSTCDICSDHVVPRYNDVRRGQSNGCGGTCRSQRIAQALRLDADASIAELLHWGWQPLTPYPGAGRAWPARCVACGSEYMKRLSHVRAGTAGCRSCSGLHVTDDAARNLMRAHGLEPDPRLPYPGAGVPWPSRCLRCGHDVTAATYAKVKHTGRSRCPVCWEAERGEALRLQPQEAAERMEQLRWRPLDPYPGKVDIPWRALCLECGQAAEPTLHNVRANGRSCATCAQRGIDWPGPGLLYLVVHDEWRVLKVGIANSRARVLQHLSQAWRSERIWKFGTARQARTVELAILTWMRSAGVQTAVAAAAMPYRGWTETARLADVSADTVTRAVEAVRAGAAIAELPPMGPALPVHPRTIRNPTR